MATKITISNSDYIIDETKRLVHWHGKGNAMPDLPSTIHYVIWDGEKGEIQNKDANGMMTGNTPLSSVDDVVGSSTVQGLLDWFTTRIQQIDLAQLQHDEALATYIAEGNSFETWTKTWRDYDPHYY
jgi:hypothetical protein